MLNGWRAPAPESGRPVELSEAVRAKLNRRLLNEGDAGPYALQTIAAVSALTRRLEAAQGNLKDIAHLTVYLDDITQFAAVERALEQTFGDWATRIDSPGSARTGTRARRLCLAHRGRMVKRTDERFAVQASGIKR